MPISYKNCLEIAVLFYFPFVRDLFFIRFYFRFHFFFRRSPFGYPSPGRNIEKTRNGFFFVVGGKKWFERVQRNYNNNSYYRSLRFVY